MFRRISAARAAALVALTSALCATVIGTTAVASADYGPPPPFGSSGYGWPGQGPGPGPGWGQNQGYVIPGAAPLGMIWIDGPFGRVLVPCPPNQWMAANFNPDGSFAGWVNRPCGDGGPCW